MALEEELNQELQKSLKSKDSLKTNTLRLLKSSLQNKGIELKKELTEEEIIKVLRQELKKRKESIKAYQAAGRVELRIQEEKEMEIINKYLPATVLLFINWFLSILGNHPNFVLERISSLGKYNPTICELNFTKEFDKRWST